LHCDQNTVKVNTLLNKAELYEADLKELNCKAACLAAKLVEIQAVVSALQLEELVNAKLLANGLPLVGVSKQLDDIQKPHINEAQSP